MRILTKKGRRLLFLLDQSEKSAFGLAIEYDDLFCESTFYATIHIEMLKLMDLGLINSRKWHDEDGLSVVYTITDTGQRWKDDFVLVPSEFEKRGIADFVWRLWCICMLVFTSGLILKAIARLVRDNFL